MIKRHLYLIAFGIMQFITISSSGQMAMPDYTCTEQERYYYVTPSQASGSTFTWWIDGTVQSGFTTNEFDYTWNSAGTYLLEVQERSANGCPGPKLPGLVFVNPLSEILVSASDSLIFDGENVTISVRNPGALTWGQWGYDLIVEPDAGITGNIVNKIYTSPANLYDTLYNNEKEINKVVYRFMPFIVNDDGVRYCEGKEVKITVWVFPRFRCREVFLDIPKAFSPNGDGINDVWNITGKESWPYIEVTIYNRWGQAVWKSGRGYPVPWDGRSIGRELPVDSYHYVIDFHNGSKLIFGDVTIVR
jgi:gliding motility-associated-like protein